MVLETEASSGTFKAPAGICVMLYNLLLKMTSSRPAKYSSTVYRILETRFFLLLNRRSATSATKPILDAEVAKWLGIQTLRFPSGRGRSQVLLGCAAAVINAATECALEVTFLKCRKRLYLLKRVYAYCPVPPLSNALGLNRWC